MTFTFVLELLDLIVDLREGLIDLRFVLSAFKYDLRTTFGETCSGAAAMFGDGILGPGLYSKSSKSLSYLGYYCYYY